MESQEFDDLVRRLTAMLVKQDGINDRLDAAIEELRTFNRQQQVFNQQQVEINARVETTLARVETLLKRVVRGGENGREASRNALEGGETVTWEASCVRTRRWRQAPIPSACLLTGG